jgi:hypothetical protein
MELYRTIDLRCEEMVDSDEPICDELKSIIASSVTKEAFNDAKKAKYDAELIDNDDFSSKIDINLVGLFGEVAALMLSEVFSPTTLVAKAFGYRQVHSSS